MRAVAARHAYDFVFHYNRRSGHVATAFAIIFDLNVPGFPSRFRVERDEVIIATTQSRCAAILAIRAVTISIAACRSEKSPPLFDERLLILRTAHRLKIQEGKNSEPHQCDRQRHSQGNSSKLILHCSLEEMNHSLLRSAFICGRSIVITSAPIRFLFLQILVEPFNRKLDGLFAQFAIDAIMRDVGKRNVFLFRAGHTVVSELCVNVIVEKFFFLGNDE